MKHLFVPYELAVKLKEKGFDKPCFAEVCSNGITYVRYGKPIKSGGVDAPLYQQVVDWFREEKNIFIQYYWMVDQEANCVVFYFKINYMWGYRDNDTYTEWAEKNKKANIEKWYDEYSECQIQSIKHALELI